MRTTTDDASVIPLLTLKMFFEPVLFFPLNQDIFRGGSRTAATSKMEIFVIIVNGLQPLTVITNCSILDVAAVLDPPLSLHWLMMIACKILSVELKQRLVWQQLAMTSRIANMLQKK